MRYFLVFLLLFSLCATAQDNSPTFVDGTQAYQSKDYERSKEIFSQLLKDHPKNPSLLYNLGLAEYKLGKKGLALGLWRKARFINSREPLVSNAIQFVQDELFPDSQQKSLPSTIYAWLKHISINLWLFITFISLFTFLWVATQLSAKRKIPFSQWPPWLYTLIPLFLFTGSMSLIFAKDSLSTKATVALNSAVTKTGPSETAPTLSNLIEGELVFVKKRQGQWAQIKTQNGSPGWVETSSLIIIER